MAPARPHMARTLAHQVAVAAAMATLAYPSAAVLAKGPSGEPDLVESRTARAIPPERTTLRRRLRFQHINRERGLPEASVSSIVQDRTGFMWLGTGDGLARYDGQRFLVFRHDPKDHSSLAASYVKSLLIARDGTLWVGTDGGGVCRYRTSDSKFDRFAPSGAQGTLKSGTIMAMSEARDGRLWVATAGGGLALLDPATAKVHTYAEEEGLPLTVTAVVAAGDGTVWVGTASGLFRFDQKRQWFEPLLQKNEELATAVVSALRVDHNGDLWIGTDGRGLARYSPASGRVELIQADPARPDGLQDNLVGAIYQDRRRRMWIGTEQALHILDPGTRRLEKYNADPEDSMAVPGRVVSVFEDREGAMWVGATGGGAGILDPLSERFEFYKTRGSSQAFASSKELWHPNIQGVCRWRGKHMLDGTCWPIGWSLSGVVSKSGRVWVGTESNGLFRLDPGSDERWIQYQNDPADKGSLGSGFVTAVYEDRRGSLWVGIFGAGPSLQRFDPASEKFVGYELPSEMVYTLAGDPERDDVLWVGTADRGLLRLEVDSGAQVLYTPNRADLVSKTDNAVVGFAFDGPDTIWIATYGGGLKRLDRKKEAFRSYRRADGMPSDALLGLLKDRRGALWLSSVAGLARFDPKTEKTEIFTPSDGLQSIEFVSMSATDLGDGRFYFGGTNGFNLFRPEDIQVASKPARLALTAVDVLGAPYRTGRELETLRRVEVGYDEEIVDVAFAPLAYSGSAQYQFEYKVEGLNDSWFHTTTASLTLTGLAEGAYTVYVRGRDRHGVQTETLQLDIDVAPPPWRTWWAYSAYGLIFVGIVYWIYRQQRARIDRLQKLARLALVEREFEVTAAVQAWFLPERSAVGGAGFNLVGFYRAADKCSGDWWWYEEIGATELWVTVADVTGHGSGPAMITAAVAMGLSMSGGGGAADMEDRLSRLNTEIRNRCKGKAMMSMTSVVFDRASGELRVYALGGLPPIVMHADGSRTVLVARGAPLGSSPDLAVGTLVGGLSVGDRLVLTTDGVIETMVSDHRQLGLRRFIQILRDVHPIPVDQAIARVIAEVDGRRVGAQEDDFTFCVLERR